MPVYRFDQIAINSTKKKKPTEADKYTYIGLEHLDSGTLEVSRWGSEVAPIGEKLIMKKGDVLFGKRRAYQKKVAIAPIDGIFSAHGMILRPNEEIVDKDYFPMFISSDYFLDEAIRISVGSLSPTINWKDLAKLEFRIPPLEEQKKAAAVLWSIEETCQAYKHLLGETDALVKAEFDRLVTENEDKTVKLQDLLVQNKKTERITSTKGEKYISVALYGKGISERDVGEDDIKAFTATRVHEGQFVYCRIWLRKGAAGIVPAELDGAVVSNEFPSFDIKKDRILPAFLMYSILDDNFLTKIGDGSKGSTSKQRIKENVFLDYSIVLPSLETQDRFDSFVKHSHKSKAALEQALKEARALQKKIVEDNFIVQEKEA